MQVKQPYATSDVTLHNLKSTVARTRNLIEKFGKVAYKVFCGTNF